MDNWRAAVRIGGQNRTGRQSRYHVERFEGVQVNQRLHTFHDLESMAAWLNRHAVNPQPDSNAPPSSVDWQKLEILVGENAVQAALTPRNEYGDLVSCPLKLHPLFQPWKDVFGKKMNQKELYSHVRANIASFTDGIGQIVTAELRKIQLTGGKDLSAELDERGFHTFRSDSNRAVIAGQFPSDFTLKLPILMGVGDPINNGQRMDYEFDVYVFMDILNDNQMVFSLTCPLLGVLMDQARRDAAAWLKSLLLPDFMVGLGELKLNPVPDIVTAA